MDNIVEVKIKAGHQLAQPLYQTIVLKPNLINNINVLSQLQINNPNTKYIIRWDYDLQNKTLLVPNNCLIEFDGGRFNNGTLIGNNTIIVSNQNDYEILKNINLKGTFRYTKYSGPKLLILTEEEYDALDHYDDNTVYFIKE